MNLSIRQYWKVALCFLGVFLAGAITGGVWTARVARKAIVKKIDPANWKSLDAAKLTRRLNLRPDQVEKINPIIEQKVHELRGMRRDEMETIARSLDQFAVTITPLLDPDQQKEYEKMMAERRERWKKFIPPQ
jgi:hypothetical protein